MGVYPVDYPGRRLSSPWMYSLKNKDFQKACIRLQAWFLLWSGQRWREVRAVIRQIDSAYIHWGLGAWALGGWGISSTFSYWNFVLNIRCGPIYGRRSRKALFPQSYQL